MQMVEDSARSATQSSAQRLIGITGGIATGKSTVSNYLATEHQLPILDADRYAREAVQQHSLILARIAERYGPQVILPGKHLNRDRLGEIVFHDPTERQWLESQIHPYVEQCFTDTVAALHDEPVLILVIPLLFEANLEHRVNEIWVVSCTPEQQLARLMDRSDLNESEAQARIDAQMSLGEKCDRAHVILHNTTTPEDLHRQIDRHLIQQPLSSGAASWSPPTSSS